MLLVADIASFIPAHRATRMDPARRSSTRLSAPRRLIKILG
jgi:hypothetical protein